MEARLNAAFSKAVDEKTLAAAGAIVLDRNGETLYKGAFGTTDMSNPDAAPFTTETILMVWSFTKLVTTVAALQLIEQGKLILDDLVEKYVPGIAENKVLLGWNEDGTPQLEDPKTKPTILHLMTHTSGLTYEFTNADTIRYHMFKKIPLMTYVLGEPEPFFDSPYAFHPGTAHEYGISTDFLGLVVEAISGEKLSDYFKTHIFEPLGMKDSAKRPELGSKGDDTNVLIHTRAADGTLTADPTLQLPAEAKMHGGGYFLYSTLEDYGKFLVTILNNGTHPLTGVKILQRETVEDYLFTEKIESAVHAPATGVGIIASAAPPASNSGELLPGLRKSWSCGLMLNLEDSAVGRRAGSGAWCSLGNSYFWIDPASGRTAMFATNTLPFFDEPALALFDELERAVYGHPAPKEGETRNFALAA